MGNTTAAKIRRAACHQHPQDIITELARLAEAVKPMLSATHRLFRIGARAKPGDQKKGRGLVRT
jgi:hypothetical protein